MSERVPIVAAEPGWYQDPAGSGGERYWDGVAWTQQVRGAGVPPPPPPQPSAAQHPGQAAAAPAPRGGSPAHASQAPTKLQPRRFGTASIVQLIGVALVAAGALLPWVDVPGFAENSYYADLPWLLTGTADESAGFIGHGYFYMSAALTAGLIAIGRYGTRVAQAVLGGAIIALVVADYLSFADAFRDVLDISMVDIVGIGFFVTAAGGATILGGALIPTSLAADTSTVQVAQSVVSAPDHQTAAMQPNSPQQQPPPPPPQTSTPQSSPPQQAPPSDNQWWN